MSDKDVVISVGIISGVSPDDHIVVAGSVVITGSPSDKSIIVTFSILITGINTKEGIISPSKISFSCLVANKSVACTCADCSGQITKTL